MTLEQQAQLRLSIFAALEEQSDASGGFLTWHELTHFELEGVRRPLAGQRGIFNPNYFDHTLSITSAPDGPYDDQIGPDGMLHYRFEAGDPTAGANRKLRAALIDEIPIILFERPLPNVYIPVIPAYVVEENLEGGYVKVATGEDLRANYKSGHTVLDKKYVERLVKQRVHQPMFRARVLTAYTGACAICRLKHRELLDAAHIIPDSEAGSSAEISNGLALCKIHHAAYDRNFLGIDPSYRVHLNSELLKEVDGPMLKHGLQEMHGVTLTTPSAEQNKPDRESLERRFKIFEQTEFIKPVVPNS